MATLTSAAAEINKTMAYKVYVKKLSADEKKRKQFRHERRMAKKQTSYGVEQLSQEQINEWMLTASNRMNIRLFEVIKTDFPEARLLMQATLALTGKHFAEAGMTDTLQAAMKQCKEEGEALLALALLSWVKQKTPAEAI